MTTRRNEKILLSIISPLTYCVANDVLCLQYCNKPIYNNYYEKNWEWNFFQRTTGPHAFIKKELRVFLFLCCHLRCIRNIGFWPRKMKFRFWFRWQKCGEGTQVSYVKWTSCNTSISDLLKYSKFLYKHLLQHKPRGSFLFEIIAFWMSDQIED